jgi:hypothetical protein
MLARWKLPLPRKKNAESDRANERSTFGGRVEGAAQGTS